MSLQKAGGIAALVEALAYVAGFAVMATLLNPGNTEGWSSAQKLSFVLERKAVFQVCALLIYVLAGAVLVVLAVAIHERFRHRSPAIMQIATAFGLIWAGLVMASGMVEIVGLESMARIHARSVTEAVSSWGAIAAVQEGLGGGIEIVGGLWVALISVAALPSTALPKTLSYLGLLVGIAGILTVVPYFAGLVAVFGLGQIVWFAWMGIVMLLEFQVST